MFSHQRLSKRYCHESKRTVTIATTATTTFSSAKTATTTIVHSTTATTSVPPPSLIPDTTIPMLAATSNYILKSKNIFLLSLKNFHGEKKRFCSEKGHPLRVLFTSSRLNWTVQKMISWTQQHPRDHRNLLSHSNSRLRFVLKPFFSHLLC